MTSTKSVRLPPSGSAWLEVRSRCPTYHSQFVFYHSCTINNPSSVQSVKACFSSHRQKDQHTQVWPHADGAIKYWHWAVSSSVQVPTRMESLLLIWANHSSVQPPNTGQWECSSTLVTSGNVQIPVAIQGQNVGLEAIGIQVLFLNERRLKPCAFGAGTLKYNGTPPKTQALHEKHVRNGSTWAASITLALDQKPFV